MIEETRIPSQYMYFSFIKKLTQKSLIIILFIFLILSSVFSDNSDIQTGPLQGTNTYLPYRLFLHTPGLSSKPLTKNAIGVSCNLYYTNDFHAYSVQWPEEKAYFQITDYENARFENIVQYQATSLLSIVGIGRFTAYYGGVLDPYIEGFHSFFGFRNAGREYFEKNDFMINIENNNGLEIYSDRPVAGIEDVDIWLKYYLDYPKIPIDMAFLSGIKLPSGALKDSSILSTGYPDIGFLYTADIPIGSQFYTYLHGGMTFPLSGFITQGEINPVPFFNGLFALAWSPGEKFTYIGQFNVKSSVISGSVKHWLFVDIDRLKLPQTNLLVGIVMNTGLYRWQLYIEEDFLTNQGADITVSLQLSRVFNGFVKR